MRTYAAITLVASSIVRAPAAMAQIAPVSASQTYRPTRDPVVARADSLVRQGDTTQALALLESLIARGSTNAVAWHRYGVLQWRAGRARRNGQFINDAATISALRKADSALRLAAQFGRDSAEYWTTLGKFSLQSDVAMMHFAAVGQFQNALDAARRVGDSAYIASASDELGLGAWRRYELIAYRALVADGQRAQLQTDGRWPRAQARSYLASFAKRIEPPTGDGEYEQALQYFRVATAVAPQQLRFSRHLFMALAAKTRWPELLNAAEARAITSPFDAQSRFAKGLALHRLGRSAEAGLVFDSAMTLLDDADRDYLFNLDRVLAPTVNSATGKRDFDARSLAAMPPAQRRAATALYWNVYDPDITTTVSEARVEFVARIVQAELFWTDDEIEIRGVDTDRGDVFVRYGPPDEIMTLPGNASVEQSYGEQADMSDKVPTIREFEIRKGGMNSTNQTGGTTLVWLYKSNDVFFFDMAAGFGTARIPLTDQRWVQDMATVKTVSWDNLAIPRRVDSLDVRTTRFRARGDSIDVVIATEVPRATLMGDSPSSPLRDEARLDLRVLDDAARMVYVDSLRRPFSASGTIAQSWTRRVGGGASVVRVDALQSDTRRTMRSLSAVDADIGRGFGISDVLLVAATSVSTAGTAEHWRELQATPRAGVYAAGEKIGLLWETYDLSSLIEQSQFRIAVSVERVKRMGAAGFALNVLDAVGNLVRQNTARAEALTISFDRTTAATPVRADYLALELQGDARGEYSLRLTVTDLGSGRVTSRETRFRIR